jgi:hypothetical protein
MAKKSSGKSMQPESVSMSMSNDKSMNIRKIENGYIVRESGYTGRGKNKNYFEKERFSPTNPVSVNMKFGKK